MNLLMVPPFPAASRPSKTRTYFLSLSCAQYWNLSSSIWRRYFSTS